MRRMNIKIIFNPVLGFLYLLGVGNCRRFVGKRGVCRQCCKGGVGRRDYFETATTLPTVTQCEIAQTRPALTANHGESLISSCKLRRCFLRVMFWREELKMSTWWWGHECLHINCRNQWTDYDEACWSIVGYVTVLWSGRWVPTFRRYILPPSSVSWRSGHAVCSAETSRRFM